MVSKRILIRFVKSIVLLVIELLSNYSQISSFALELFSPRYKKTWC